VNGQRQWLADRQRLSQHGLMGSWRGVDIENEISRLTNDFVAELDGKL
jgi:hypothetical protein